MKTTLLVLTLFISSMSNCGGQTSSQNQSTAMDHVTVFVENYANYSMNIQAAGLASIPKATISENGELYVEYAYVSENENRVGKMTLQHQGNNRFEGNWKTEADNGNSYEGSLYFVFETSGDATGHYQFGGSDYNISIFKTKK